jgi:hypothetical protein
MVKAACSQDVSENNHHHFKESSNFDTLLVCDSDSQVLFTKYAHGSTDNTGGMIAMLATGTSCTLGPNHD